MVRNSEYTMSMEFVFEEGGKSLLILSRHSEKDDSHHKYVIKFPTERDGRSRLRWVISPDNARFRRGRRSEDGSVLLIDFSGKN